MTTDIIYLNGKYVSESDAKISVFDRGFLFADGVYEVIPVYKGKITFLQEHLKRLTNSLKAINIEHPLEFQAWQEICDTLINKNGNNRPIYIQITRGRDSMRSHNYPDNLHPTIVALSLAPIELGNCLDTKNLKVITLNDVRWKMCHIKTVSLLGNILLNQTAVEQGAKEALLINNEGNIVEGASSNIFIVKNDKVITPIINNEILPGITRQVVLEICKDNNIPITEQAITQEDIYSADEVWLTSSTKEIRPVLQINEHLVNNGKPGKIWLKVANLYIEYINRIISED